MSLTIVRAGILDTVQDLGRPGYRSLGVNPGGAADPDAVRLANVLLGNDEGAAVIEMHFPAPAIRFGEKSTIALAGAEFRPSIDGEPIGCWQTIDVPEGSILAFGGRAHGTRCYLAIRGGIDVRQWLGSRSTNLYAQVGGLNGSSLSKGDRLMACQSDAAGPGQESIAGRSLTSLFHREPVLRVTPGPEFRDLTAVAANKLFSNTFEVGTDSNRMGTRLKGERLSTLDDPQMVSGAVVPGTIQLLPGGQIVVLGSDCQTTGGYPRIANVCRADLSIAAQLSPGDPVRFELITLDEALVARERFERDLSFLRMGLRFRTFREK